MSLHGEDMDKWCTPYFINVEIQIIRSDNALSSGHSYNRPFLAQVFGDVN